VLLIRHKGDVDVAAYQRHAEYYEELEPREPGLLERDLRHEEEMKATMTKKTAARR
jgi:hypothetical protein